MQWDQIIRELKKLGLKPIISKKVNRETIKITFKTKHGKIEAYMMKDWEAGTGRIGDKNIFNANISERKEGKVHPMSVHPNNMNEFYKIVAELKTTGVSLREIYNRENIIKTKKEIKKIQYEFNRMKFELFDRKSYLKYLEGKITRKEYNKEINDFYKKIFG